MRTLTVVKAEISKLVISQPDLFLKNVNLLYMAPSIKSIGWCKKLALYLIMLEYEWKKPYKFNTANRKIFTTVIFSVCIRTLVEVKMRTFKCSFLDPWHEGANAKFSTTVVETKRISVKPKAPWLLIEPFDCNRNTMNSKINKTRT
jgi:hypothetical protein